MYVSNKTAILWRELINVKNSPTECEVNFINDSLLYSDQHFISIYSRKRVLSIFRLNIISINANYTEFKLFININYKY